jgi:DNA-binding MarR family transcriptional regulator
MTVFRDFIQGMTDYNIRPAQFSVLTVIGANPGLTQRDLGQRLAIEPARLVLMLDELEERGLCRRKPAPTDRRSRTLVLTPKGTHQLRQLTELANQHEARALAKLGAADQRRLLALLRALIDG